MVIKISDISVHPTSVINVAKLAEPYRVCVQAIDAHGEPAVFRQSVSVNEDLLTERAGGAHLSVLITFTGKLSDFEQIPGNRTRLMLSFGALPSGVALFATEEAVAGEPHGLGAVLIKADPSRRDSSNDPNARSAVIYKSRSIGLSRIEVHDDTAQAVWEIENGAGGEQSLTVGIAVAYIADPTKNVPSTGNSQVIGYLGPLSTVNTASSTDPIPRFAPWGVPQTAFTIMRS